MMNWTADFPILAADENGNRLVYLDSAATTQHPMQVLNAVVDYYTKENANPHRGVYELAMRATDAHEGARHTVAQFFNAEDDEIVFTQNTTESLNLVAYSYGLHNVKAGDEIVISITEHHSNLVPWQFVAKTTGATLKYIYLEKDGNLSDEDIETKITEKTKIVAVTQVSNVLGLKNDVKKIVKKAHSVGAVAVVDGSQRVAHMKVDVRDLDCDFFAFSGHKMLSPMGIGVLYGKYDILDAMPPFLRGGDMIEYVEEQDTTYAELPAKFEAGTQNVGGAAGLTAAIDYLETITFDRIEAIEKDLVDYALPQLREQPYIELYGCDTPRDNKTGIIAFNVKDVHPHDVASILDSYGVAVRAGHHCAQPLLAYLKHPSTARASLAFYNTESEVDRLLDSISTLRERMGYGK